MKKILFVGIMVVIGIGVIVYYFLNSAQITMFPTREACENKTGKNCRNDNLCDYNCPRGFHKGWWMPSSQTGDCAQRGETIGAQGMPTACCEGLKPVGGHPGGYTGECSVLPIPGGLSICSACGDTLCETTNGENKCNCPQDCE